MAPVAKRRRVDKPLKNGATPRKSADDALLDSSFPQHMNEWDVEEQYEARRAAQKAAESNRLPVKTKGQYVPAPQVKSLDDESSDSSFGSSEDETPATDHSEDESTAVPTLSAQEELVKAQEELAKAATLLSEAPEEHIGSLKTLTEITESAANVTVLQYALKTQLLVYKDIIPGYRIRPIPESELSLKISKDVKRQRQFEQSIVKGYQKYVQTLARIASGKGNTRSFSEGPAQAIAVSCAAGLLESVSHFNFREDILKILVARLASRNEDNLFHTARRALEKLFEEDEEGDGSLEAVQLLSKMMKARSYYVSQAVLNTFLRLRLLSELVIKASDKRVDKPEDDEKPKLRGKKARQAAWEHRSKKEKKAIRERKVIEKEMKEADAQVSYEEKDRNQSETLKLVFSIYLRILKAKVPYLMGAVLEGLVRYAHLINQEFFGDLLEALRELILESEAPPVESEDGEPTPDTDPTDDTPDPSVRNVARESLLCVITAFALLQGQDASKAASGLSIDLDFFIQHLYHTLCPASLNPDLELSAKTLRAADPDSDEPSSQPATKVNVQTTIVLLLRSLQAVLLPPSNPRAVPPVRLAAFSHQIMTSALQMPEKSATAMLGLMNQTAKQHKLKIASLWRTEERRANGVFDAYSADVEASNPFAGTLWEGELLRLHYAPSVREGVKALEKVVMS